MGIYLFIVNALLNKNEEPIYGEIFSCLKHVTFFLNIQNKKERKG